MDNKRVKFCLKILSRFGKIIKKPQRCFKPVVYRQLVKLVMDVL